MIDPTVAALTVAAFFIGGFVKGALGLGLPVVVLAFLAQVMPLRDAMAIFLLPGLVSNIWQATNGPWMRPILSRLWVFLVAAVVGIFIGVWLTAGSRSEIMVSVLGALLCAYSVYCLTAPRLPEPGRHERWLSPACGGVGGVLLGMSGLFLIPGITYVETLRMPRDQFVQALGITFVTVILGLAASMGVFGLLTIDLGLVSLIGLVPVFLGIWAGRRARRGISEAFYRKLFFVALFVIGAYMLVRTLGAI